jgi:hypothetical protein
VGQFRHVVVRLKIILVGRQNQLHLLSAALSERSADRRGKTSNYQCGTTLVITFDLKYGGTPCKDRSRPRFDSELLGNDRPSNFSSAPLDAMPATTIPLASNIYISALFLGYYPIPGYPPTLTKNAASRESRQRWAALESSTSLFGVLVRSENGKSSNPQ